MMSTNRRPFSFCTTRQKDGWLVIAVYRSGVVIQPTASPPQAKCYNTYNRHNHGYQITFSVMF